MVDINETLLRQIVEDVLKEMQGADKPVSFAKNTPATGNEASSYCLTRVTINATPQSA